MTVAYRGSDYLKKETSDLVPSSCKILRPWCSASFLLRFIWQGTTTHCLLFGLWPQTLSETAPSAALQICHHSAQKWIFHKQMYSHGFWWQSILSKTKHFCGFRPHFIYAVSIWGWWSPFICLSGFVGNHLKTDHTCSLSSYIIGCLFIIALWVAVCAPVSLCVCVCLYLSDGISLYVLCVHVPPSTCSSTGSEEACYSDLWLMSAFGQQACMCVSMRVYVCVWARLVWSQI